MQNSPSRVSMLNRLFGSQGNFIMCDGADKDC